MEVWYNFQTNKYYKIDSSNGRQSPSNRFGREKKSFQMDLTGFPRTLSPKPKILENGISLQPKRFDGYCQFPRPPDQARNISPYNRGPNKNTPKIHITEPSKIPQPLPHLRLSRSPSQKASPRLLTTSLSSINISESICKKPISTPTIYSIKTIEDLKSALSQEKISYKGYTPPVCAHPRRKLKGFFSKNFKTSSELCKVDKSMILLTNPTFAKKLQKIEENEAKMLIRKKQATKLLQLTTNY